MMKTFVILEKYQIWGIDLTLDPETERAAQFNTREEAEEYAQENCAWGWDVIELKS
jgi:hypothetical protein